MLKNETYGFGTDVERLAKEEAGKYATIVEAVKNAKEAGVGFVVGYSRSDRRPYRAIYAWDVQIISGKEARDIFKDSPQKLNIIDDHPTEVFIVSPAGNGQTILFPFAPFRKLEVAPLKKLLE